MFDMVYLAAADKRDVIKELLSEMVGAP